MTQYLRPSTETQSSANIILKNPACPDAHLPMIIHGFAFWKFAKPAYEHHLQVLPAHRKPSSLTLTGTLKMLRHLTDFEKVTYRNR
jgi:hypothetical protein